jgi:hypothetical protein
MEIINNGAITMALGLGRIRTISLLPTPPLGGVGISDIVV